MKRKIKTHQLPRGLEGVVILQAQAFYKQSRITFNIPDHEREWGQSLAHLTTTALAIELYLKALTMRMFQGQFWEGHNLVDLVDRLPEPVMVCLREHYARHPRASTAPVPLTSIISDRAKCLDLEAQPRWAPPVTTFDAAVKQLSNSFVESRYFFEKVSDKGWVRFGLPLQAIEALLDSLERALEEFAGPCPSAPSGAA